MHDYDVVVIGAGQAGLATGHELGRTPLSYLLLEADEQVGGAWSHYYDSLTLFSPARFCSLPGLPMPGDPGRYPTRDETVEYLRNYAQHFAIPVRTGAAVHRVQRDAAPGWAIELATGEAVTARAVVVATGGYRNPYRPRIDEEATYGGTVLHVADYRTPEPFTGQRVVVVGAGNSAIQVAHELAQVTEVTLATRSPVSLRDSRPLGIDLHYWVAWSGIDRLPLGRRAGTSVGVLDDGTYAAALASGRPARREMFTGFTDAGVRWPDGSTEPVDVVIFATGYRPNLGYLSASAFGGDGWPLHHRGVSSTHPSLGFVGLPGQTGLASATLRGVGPDARRVVRNLTTPLLRGAAARPGSPVVGEPDMSDNGPQKATAATRAPWRTREPGKDDDSLRTDPRPTVGPGPIPGSLQDRSSTMFSPNQLAELGERLADEGAARHERALQELACAVADQAPGVSAALRDRSAAEVLRQRAFAVACLVLLDTERRHAVAPAA